MRPTWSLLPILLAMSACSSAPKPPTVDESNKRPANSAMAVELQVCKSDLQNTRIVGAESSRAAESAAAMLARLAAQQQAVVTASARVPTAAPGNSVFTIRFGYRSTHVVVPADIVAALVASARSAPLVLLRGRTDGVTDTMGESRVARERAAAVRDYLVEAGVDAARIRVTYQPVGDHVTENTSPSGRALNRRVEIEAYRAMPTPEVVPRNVMP